MLIVILSFSVAIVSLLALMVLRKYDKQFMHGAIPILVLLIIIVGVLFYILCS